MRNTFSTEIDLLRRNINDSVVECLFTINENIKNLKTNYSDSLIELLSVLQDNQNDLNFLYDEGKSIAEYMKSKGCKTDDIQLLIKGITDSFC